MARERSGRDPDDPHTDVAGALHDVSNALTVILGWVGEAREASATPASIAHSLFVIEQQARIARDLARRAVGARPDHDDGDDSLDAILRQTFDALALEAARGGIELVRAGQIGSVRVLAAGDLLQVLLNLALNALAHAPPATSITFEAKADPQGTVVEVQDEGPGVAAARRDVIFDGASDRVGGAGLGLRHSRALARAVGGDLALVPSPSGARFRVTWPRVDPVSIAPPSTASAQQLAGTRVLVVEDDPHVTMLLEVALGSRGAIVTVAHDAHQLDAAQEDAPYDVALVDLSPIAADVEGAIASLRKRSPKVVLVFISGSAVGLPKGLEGEAVRWVRKPFEVGELVSTLLAARGTGA